MVDVNARGEVVVPCDELAPTLAFFVDRLGFRLDTIMPADDPHTAVVSGHGLRLRLEPGADGAAIALRLTVQDDAGARDRHGTCNGLTAPNGTRIELCTPASARVGDDELPLLVDRLEVSQPDVDDGGIGRAGMHYRDLIPGRHGGRVIASEITIPDGGPVADYVHHHRIRFQAIYCAAGWVRVVYEDQGEAFVLEAGDCVVQPPGIRHRVLESSAGARVIEISSPAEHETHVEHELTLPTSTLAPDTTFGGQRFVRHQASGAAWDPWRDPAFESSDTGIALATGNVGGVRVVRPGAGTTQSTLLHHDGELLFWFVLDGDGELRVADEATITLSSRTAVTIPARVDYRLTSVSSALRLLEVTLPGAPARSGE